MSDLPFDPPAPPELATLAERLIRDHPECFWFRHPEAKIETCADVRWVIRNLRNYGNKAAWWEAQALQRCLSPYFRKTS